MALKYIDSNLFVFITLFRYFRTRPFVDFRQGEHVGVDLVARWAVDWSPPSAATSATSPARMETRFDEYVLQRVRRLRAPIYSDLQAHGLP